MDAQSRMLRMVWTVLMASNATGMQIYKQKGELLERDPFFTEPYILSTDVPVLKVFHVKQGASHEPVSRETFPCFRDAPYAEGRSVYSSLRIYWVPSSAGNQAWGRSR